MARQRFIHPGIWSDPVFGHLTDTEQVLYIGLFSNADDEGRILAGAAYLKSVIWPHRDVPVSDVQATRDTVVDRFDAIRLYTFKGVDYIAILNWSAYQKPKYPTPSKLPAPEMAAQEPAPDAGLRVIPEGFPQASGNVPPGFPQSSPNPPEGFPRNVPTGLGLGLGKGEEANASSAERDEIWDALIVECGPVATASERTRRNRYRKELATAGATATEIHRRAARLRARWPDIDLTDNSLVKNWSKADMALPAGDGRMDARAILDTFGNSIDPRETGVIEALDWRESA